ncbi:hypothetical protein AC629_04240, partial [Bradyrhizobium sp. NAS80.1]|uniref:Ig-like domain repeat protein n=1 Tax=Bradyrhizobium sp. NAS80.1 TaxID=1680159 RepID=UPI0009666C82
MYNTAVQTSLASRPAGSSGTQGFMLNDNGSVVANAEFAYNTMLDLPGAQSSPLTTVDVARVTGAVSVHDNFAVTSGGNGYGSDSFFADPTYSPNALYYHNINMSTGGLYYQNATVEPTAAIAPTVNPLVAPVITTPSNVPSTPVITSLTANGNIVTLKGTATSNDNFPSSTVQIFDGSTQIGLADTDGNGNWSFTTGSLAAGTHSFTAKSNGFYGYVSPVSAAVSETIGSTAGAVLTSITETPSTGDLNVGKTVTFTLNMSSAVTVTGTPTLTLNDGGTASYASGSGSKALTFTYTVGSSDTNVSSLAANSINLPGVATIKDSSGNNASLTLTGLTQTGPQIDTIVPNAPVETNASIVSGTTKVQLTGTAEANSTVQVFDGT